MPFWWRRRRRWAIVGVLLALVAGATGRRWWPVVRTLRFVASAPADLGERRGPYLVTHVVDGDTIDVAIGRVRLLRIDTPERDQPGFERATAAMKALVEGREVTLVGEGQERDVYGRLLAYVFLDDVDVNLEMVRRGWSRFYVKYGEGGWAEQFRAAEAEARAKNAGLWSSEGWNVIDDRPAAPPRRSRRPR